jgi:hypothetical protein
VFSAGTSHLFAGNSSAPNVAVASVIAGVGGSTGPR